ncbi:cell wall hydrolase [Sphingomonas sp. Leaf21]|uniref:cell wall hydrolase n=1 Tax=Sphingomonas sp. Leaf21 TaxID=2876550 RepID=UPI001E529179|nr:cell wall hydrolase [Sphingomonas sp. Leaf21]
MALVVVIGLVVALFTMDDDSDFFDAIPFASVIRPHAQTPDAQAEQADDIPLDTLVPSAVLELSPQDALARNMALPLSRVANPIAPPFVGSWLGADREKSATCLANAVYYEANGEPLAGQRAVAQVVLNRLRHPRFPKTVCEVVYQGSERPTGCQFSFTCDGSLARAPNPARYKIAMGVANAALDGWVSVAAGQATHYHTLYVFPKWAPELLKLGVVGHHIFYRLPGRFYDYEAFRSAAAALPVDPTLPLLTGDAPVPAAATAAGGLTMPPATAPDAGLRMSAPPTGATTTAAPPTAATLSPTGPVTTTARTPQGVTPAPAPSPTPEGYFPSRRNNNRPRLPMAQQ